MSIFPSNILKCLILRRTESLILQVKRWKAHPRWESCDVTLIFFFFYPEFVLPGDERHHATVSKQTWRRCCGRLYWCILGTRFALIMRAPTESTSLTSCQRIRLFLIKLLIWPGAKKMSLYHQRLRYHQQSKVLMSHWGIKGQKPPPLTPLRLKLRRNSLLHQQVYKRRKHRHQQRAH